MSAELAVQMPLNLTLIDDYRKVSDIRNEQLFTEFLQRGYRMTTLSTVDPKLFEVVQYCKLSLGLFITLIDDLADHPLHRDEQLLQAIESVVFSKAMPEVPIDKSKVFNLAVRLYAGVLEKVAKLPFSEPLIDALKFDLQKIVLANRFSYTISENQYLANPLESKIYGPYNMGMVAAGMIDLMACTSFRNSETGTARMIFIHGQRIGRIANVLATYERELKEGDQTNELAIELDQRNCSFNLAKQQRMLFQEVDEKIEEIEAYSLESFDCQEYADGVKAFFQLHFDMQEKI